MERVSLAQALNDIQHELLKMREVNWPARFFEDICIDDPAFVRPPQGDTPPAPAIDWQ
ncbi:MAG: hypothetical protein ETSY1_40630 [Candidatus Entotheonella factor]|uniref:Uncharacterized protein n=1 Tax=Entotheonella factor TaxID=1429438 RepID=W4L6Y5_ENTF1|nr:MAG: hypothetical protein ETSY1_40630 [Candidatus Entotheonella factor]